MRPIEPRKVDPDLEARWLDAGYWVDETLGELLDRGLLGAPDTPFMVHSATRPTASSFGDVRARAARVAGALREHGVGPGDVVAFQLPNCVEAAITFYATALLGAVIVPIVHFYGPKEVGFILRRTEPKAFVTMSSFGLTNYLDALERIADDVANVELIVVVGDDAGGHTAFTDLEAGPQIEGPASTDPRDPALIAFTSGTTAEPKGVVHSHRTLGAEIRQLSATMPTEAPPNLVGAPVGHAIGMLGALLMPVLVGNPIHLIDIWDPAAVLRTMKEHQLSAGTGATFFLQSLLDHPDLSDDHLALMGHIGLGGSQVPAAISERARDVGISIVRMYGSTEHPSITGAWHHDPVDKRLYTDGRALPGVEIKLVDGEILSRGPDCFIGYTDEMLTAAAFDDDGWFHTEDIGIIDEDGWLRITDRKKDIIIRGGENVSAVEVEELLVRVPGVAEAVVVAGPDPRLGERVCAFLRMHEGLPLPSLDDVRIEMQAAGLARQKWPEELHPGDDLPRTPSGKVQKALLRARLRD